MSKKALIDETPVRAPVTRTKAQRDIVDFADLALKAWAVSEAGRIRTGIEEQAVTIRQAARDNARHQEAIEGMTAEHNFLLRQQVEDNRAAREAEASLIRMQKRILSRKERSEQERRDIARLERIKRKKLGIHLSQYDDVLQLARELTVTIEDAARIWRGRLHELELGFLLPGGDELSPAKILAAAGLGDALAAIEAEFPGRLDPKRTGEKFDLDVLIGECLATGKPLRELIAGKIEAQRNLIEGAIELDRRERELIARIEGGEVRPHFVRKVCEAERDLTRFRAEMELPEQQTRVLHAVLLMLLPPVAILFGAWKVFWISQLVAVAMLVARRMHLGQLLRLATNEDGCRPFEAEAAALRHARPDLTARDLFDGGMHAWFQITCDPGKRGMDLLCARHNLVFSHDDAATFMDLYRKWEGATGEMRDRLATILFFAIDSGLRSGEPVVKTFTEKYCPGLEGIPAMHKELWAAHSTGGKVT